jgi:hypothetical protein
MSGTEKQLLRYPAHTYCIVSMVTFKTRLSQQSECQNGITRTKAEVNIQMKHGRPKTNYTRGI